MCFLPFFVLMTYILFFMIDAVNGSSQFNISGAITGLVMQIYKYFRLWKLI